MTVFFGSGIVVPRSALDATDAVERADYLHVELNGSVIHLEIRNYRQLYRYVDPGELLAGAPGEDRERWWGEAQPGSFALAA